MFDDFDDDLIDEDDLPMDGGEGFALDAEPEGLTEPRLSTECIGYDALEQQLLSAIDKGNMPHSIMLTGPKGIGKSTFAFRLARYLLSQCGESADGGLFGDELPKEAADNMDVAREDKVYRQIAAQAHPDLLVIERKFDEKKGVQKSGVEVDEVRRVAPFLRRTASQGLWRVVIVDDADTMNRSSQNAILKILEEPPSDTILILVVHRAGAMVPTIRSRCRSFAVKLPSFETFTKLVKKQHPSMSVDEMEMLYNISGGSTGQALSLAAEGALESIESLIYLLESWPQWDWPHIHTLADNLARPGQDQSARVFRNIFFWTMQTVMKAKARGESLVKPLDNDAVQRMMDHYSLEDWIEICENITQHFDLIEKANLDKKQMVLGAFSIFDIKKAA